MIRPGWFGLEEQNSSKPKKKRSNSQFSEMVRVLFRKSSSKLERERVCRIGFRPKTGDQTNRKSVTWSNRTGITLKSELSNKALGSNSELSPKIGRRRKANQFKKKHMFGNKRRPSQTTHLLGSPNCWLACSAAHNRPEIEPASQSPQFAIKLNLLGFHSTIKKKQTRITLNSTNPKKLN